MPSRILLATVGTTDDVQPFAVMAATLRDAGHEVALCPGDIGSVPGAGCQGGGLSG